MKLRAYVCWCLLLLLLMAGCGHAPAAIAPEAPAEEAAAAVPEAAAPQRGGETAEADLEGLAELLDRAENMQPCAAGSSLRAAALAGGLLEWLAANPAPASALRKAALSWAADKSEAERARTGRTLRLLKEAAGGMEEERLRALLEDAGCPLPETCPEKDEYLSLLTQLSLAITPKIFINPGETVNISN